MKAEKPRNEVTKKKSCLGVSGPVQSVLNPLNSDRPEEKTCIKRIYQWSG